MMHKEIWEPIEFDFEYIDNNRYEISNFGRVRSFNRSSDGKILKGSTTEGYNIFRFKFHKAKTPEFIELTDFMKSEIADLKKEYKLKPTSSTFKQIEKKSVKLSKILAKNLKQRTIHHHFLVHRKVAEIFIPKESEDQTIVAHLDFNKQNNKSSNLKWMTPEENAKHQQKSPYVIAEQNIRKTRKRKSGAKLDVTQVMLIKKQLKRGIPNRRIAKNFNVSEMQIHRIKTGENWGHIEVS